MGDRHSITPGDQPPDGDRLRDDSAQQQPVFDPGLTPLIEQAIDDLSVRLGIDRATITAVSAELTTWADGGFLADSGLRRTPQPIDGSEIVLVCGGQRYRYRTGGQVYRPTLYR